MRRVVCWLADVFIYRKQTSICVESITNSCSTEQDGKSCFQMLRVFLCCDVHLWCVWHSLFQVDNSEVSDFRVDKIRSARHFRLCFGLVLSSQKMTSPLRSWGTLILEWPSSSKRKPGQLLEPHLLDSLMYSKRRAEQCVWNQVGCRNCWITVLHWSGFGDPLLPWGVYSRKHMDVGSLQNLTRRGWLQRVAAPLSSLVWTSPLTWLRLPAEAVNQSVALRVKMWEV